MRKIVQTIDSHVNVYANRISHFFLPHYFLNRLRLEDPSKSFAAINELILSQGLQEQLKDFDNHLDDVSNDWRNQGVNEKIAKFVA